MIVVTSLLFCAALLLSFSLGQILPLVLHKTNFLYQAVSGAGSRMRCPCLNSGSVTEMLCDLR